AAVSRELLLCDGEGRAVTRRLTCLGLPRWALRVGATREHLLLLDAERPAVLLLPLAGLRALASGGACDPQRPPVHRLALASRDPPYAGLLLGDRLYLSFFSSNRVELHRLRAGATPRLELERVVRFPAPENLGLSDLALHGGELVVAATGYRCFARHCPGGRFGEGRLFFLSASGEPRGPGLATANRNPAGLYTHAPTGVTYLLSAGELEGGHGSLERLLGSRRLGPPLRLARGAATARAFPLGLRDLALLAFAGDRLTIVDAYRDRLRAVLRFDGRALRAIPPHTPVPDRRRADLQDLVPLGGEEHLLLDSQNDQLVRLRYRERNASASVTARTPLRAGRARAGPSWAFWLERARPGR
ncbi:MAG: hypothetical protein ACOY3Y_07095, partial [Acidobacteriota bacterium]